MKNFDLNIENVLLLNWNFIYTIMIYNILKGCANFHCKLARDGGGGSRSNTLCRFNNVQWYYTHVWIFF